MSSVNLPKFQFRGTTQEARDKELTDYLFKLTEEIENALEDIGEDNLSSSLSNKVNAIKTIAELLTNG